MTTAVQPAALALIAAMAVAPAAARAEEKPAAKVVYKITLDIDHDGKLDRAAVVQDPASSYADLVIYLDGPGPLDPSRIPSFLKKNLTADPVVGLESAGKGSLKVKYGRVGLGSNQYEMALTITHRRNEFWVVGFAKTWDMRDGSIGSCDINFLTGKGVATHSNAKPRPIKAKFAPIKLSDWSDAKRPKACN
jgi:hypothetical protein